MEGSAAKIVCLCYCRSWGGWGGGFCWVAAAFFLLFGKGRRGGEEDIGLDPGSRLCLGAVSGEFGAMCRSQTFTIAERVLYQVVHHSRLHTL